MSTQLGTESHNALIFLFLALFCGVTIVFLLSRYKSELPYTVVVFGIGIVFSLLHRYSQDSLHESITMWGNFDPHLLLYVFLPALLFGEAMSLNAHHFSNALSSCLLLAGPGALFCAFAFAAAVRVLLPYEWSWGLCLVVGAIMCTTDAVAIVALLKKAGASFRLSYLMVGESLFNDATALVLYHLFFSLVATQQQQQEFTVWRVAVYFLKVLLISPLLGVAFGAGTLLLLSLANRRMSEEDTTVQIVLTICCAYLSFFTAEEVLQVSGVVCCVVAALMLSRFGPPLILHHHTMHSVWSTIEWVGNTLIFTLAGLIIGERSILYMEPRDVAHIVLAYCLLVATRAAMMLLCFPLLRQMGNRCTVFEAVFVTWGGLRGAISMAIALSLCRSVDNNETSISEHDAHKLFLIVGGTATLTLIVNVLTSAPLLHILGLAEGAQQHHHEAEALIMYVKRRIYSHATALLEKECYPHTNNISGAELEPVYCNRQLVVRYCSVFSQFAPDHCEEQGGEAEETHRTSVENSCKHSQLDSGGVELGPRSVAAQHSISSITTGRTLSDTKYSAVPELVVQVRRAFLEVVRVSYWRQISSGKLPRQSSATLMLLNSIDVALEATTNSALGLQDWTVLTKLCHSLETPTTSATIVSPANNVFHPSPTKTTLHTHNSHLSDLEWELTFDSSKSAGVGKTDQSLLRAAHHSLHSQDSSGGSLRANTNARRVTGPLQFFRHAWQEYHLTQQVYIITSFVDAHRYAQLRIKAMLGESDVFGPLEEHIVIAESRAMVQIAMHCLRHIDHNVVTLQVSKQTARWVLHAQEDMVEEFRKEGILSARDAELLLEEVQGDLRALGAVEWSSIVMSKVMHLLATRVCGVCTGAVTNVARCGGSGESRFGVHRHVNSSFSVETNVDMHPPL